MIITNFIKHDIVETEFYNINVSHPKYFLNLQKIYCGARTEAFVENVIENKTLTQSECDNFKKPVLKFYITLCNQIKSRFNFKNKYLTFASKFAPSNVKVSAEPSVAGFINLFPQIDRASEHRLTKL
jgi:hypothetical protein